MTLPRLTLLAIGLTFVGAMFILAIGMPDGRIFLRLFSVHDLPGAWLMVGMLIFGYWYGARLSGDGAWIERLLLTLDRQRYLVAIVLWMVLCAGTFWVYRNHPLSMDEYAAVFQAKIFAGGAMHGEFPPDLLNNLIPPRVQNYFLSVNHSTGAVFSTYWPGFSLLLTPFVWLGVPWACNPTVVAASFIIIGRIARDLVVSPFAPGWALLFGLASPAFVVNGMTYYSMPAHLLFSLGFAWLLLAPTPLRLFLAGLVGGFALVLHNPFPHMAFALPWVLWLATRKGKGLRNIGYLAAGYLPMVLLLGAGWPLWKQEMLQAGTQSVVAVESANIALGTLPDRALGLLRSFFGVLSIPDGIILFDRLAGLVKLWLWSVPLLILLAWRGGYGDKQPGLKLLGASALLTYVAYFVVPFDQGHGWGYRYFHSAWGVLPVLAALGVTKMVEAGGASVMRQLALVTVFSMVAANGLRMAQMGQFMASHLAQFPPRVEAERRIVLHNGRGYYPSDLIQNDPWLRCGEIVMLIQNASRREKIMSYFPLAQEVSANDYGVTLVDQGAAP